MVEVLKRMLLSSDCSIDKQTKFELEIVRQTIIAIKKMKEKGDSITECEAFSSGFILATRIMVEVMQGLEEVEDI